MTALVETELSMPVSFPIITPLLMRSAASKRRQEREWAWVMAMASASAASALSKVARGKRQRTMARICVLSPWPLPTTVFFTAVGAYPRLRAPKARARGARSRAWPRLQRGRVAINEGLLDGGLDRRKLGQDARQAVENLPQSRAQTLGLVGDDRPAGDEAEPAAVGVDDPPAGAPEARIDADDANAAHKAISATHTPGHSAMPANHLRECATEGSRPRQNFSGERQHNSALGNRG